MSEERLLPHDAYVQNRQTQAHFVFSGDSDRRRESSDHGNPAGDDSLEMTSFQRSLTSRKNFNPWKQDAGPGQEEPDTAFILHEVEDHHTLTGIALQYRTTVDQLKRLNNIWGEAELHARKVIKVPASKYGHLYAAVQESKLDDLDGLEQDVKTYTTKRPYLPTENPDISLPSEAFSSITYGDEPTPANSGASESVDSMEVLTRYDQQLQTVIEHQDQLESQSVADARVIGLTRQENAWTTFTTPSMWKRAIALLVLMVIIVPVAVYKLYPQDHQQ